MAELQTCTTIGCSTDTTKDVTSLPGKPASVDVRVASENTLHVTIEPPVDDGGANVTEYQLTWDILGQLFEFPTFDSANSGILDTTNWYGGLSDFTFSAFVTRTSLTHRYEHK